MKHLNAVILAGGSGTRLWPLSTPTFPKQFLPLPSGNSMIQETLLRVAPLVSAEQSWVVTGCNMADLVEEHLPSISSNHILREPMGRGSAPAIAWVAATIAQQDPEAIMAIFSADAGAAPGAAARPDARRGHPVCLRGSRGGFRFAGRVRRGGAGRGSAGAARSPGARAVAGRRAPGDGVPAAGEPARRGRRPRPI